jgi:stage II sporulation protein D
MLDKIGDNRGAWLAARRALGQSSKDEEALKILKRNSAFLKGDPDAASGVRRIARPVLDSANEEPALPLSSRLLRVGLYGAPDGKPATMTHAYVMVNSPFKVTAAAYGTMRDNGRAYDQWEIEYRADAGLVEVRDAARNLLFVSKQPFAFTPQSKRGSVLIKSAKVIDAAGVDIGDREMRGTIEVVPNPWGFRLVNEVPLELYLYGVVSLGLPDGSPPDAFKAQAVVSRTAALWALGHRAQTLERCDLLDDRSTQATISVSGEMSAAAEAVRSTEGIAITEKGLVTRAPQHDDSGGKTENGSESGISGMESFVSVPDGAHASDHWNTPLEFEHFLHEPPSEGLYSDAAPGRTAAAARWIRLINVRDLRQRSERARKIGRLRALRILGRTSTGRVKAIEAIGTEASDTFTGFDEIQEFLSPGSLRSLLFSFQPIYDGKKISHILIWGAGTGTGLGFSRAGAVGQAALGKSWREIVKHYFPHQEISDVDRVTRSSANPLTPNHRRVAPIHRTLNFRRKLQTHPAPTKP